MNDLSFSIGPSEIVGFLGVNGAGKTTSFLLATGFLKPSSGTIRLNGVNPREDKSWSDEVGVLMAGGGVYPRLTVRRNLSFFAEILGSDVDLDEHLERHGLSEYAEKPASQLSHGYRRRLALARACLRRPKLLLLDEPADGLDPAATDSLHEYLRRFKDQGGGVVFTSHRLEEVESLCDRVLVLSEGVIAREGPTAELAGDQGLRALLRSLQK